MKKKEAARRDLSQFRFTIRTGLSKRYSIVLRLHILMYTCSLPYRVIMKDTDWDSDSPRNRRRSQVISDAVIYFIAGHSGSFRLLDCFVRYSRLVLAD